MPILALSLSACAATRGEPGFAAAPGQSFILLGADGMDSEGKRGFTFVFRKLDMKSAEFLKEDLRIEFTGSESRARNRIHQAGKFEDLAALRRPSGDAGRLPALISLVVRAGGPPRRGGRHLLRDGAPVFHIVEGQISIIAARQSGGLRGPSELRVEDEATQMLKSHPGYSAPATNTRAFGSVPFDITGAQDDNRACGGRELRGAGPAPVQAARPFADGAALKTEISFVPAAAASAWPAPAFPAASAGSRYSSASWR